MHVPEGFSIMAPHRRKRAAVIVHPKWRQIRLNAAAYRLLGSPDRVDVAWDGARELMVIPAESGRFGMQTRTLFFPRDEWAAFAVPSADRFFAVMTMADGALRVRLQDEEESAS